MKRTAAELDELERLADRLKKSRVSIRKRGMALYGPTGKYHILYAAMHGKTNNAEALDHLRTLAADADADPRKIPALGRRIEKRIKCKCPKCGGLHTKSRKELLWTNPLIKIPRIYCDSCRRILFPPEGDPSVWESLEQLREEEFKEHEPSNNIWAEL